MRIPNNTLSASQFRTYGAAGFTLDEQEDEQGCPRLYAAKYASEERLPEEESYPLMYGSFVHRVLYLLEEGVPLDDAMTQAWDVRLPPEAMTEARKDLDEYLARGAAPSDKYGVLGTELDLRAPLFEHPDVGTIYYRGILDSLLVDLDETGTLHVWDYKTNRQPPSERDLDGDVQMRGYAWLVLQHADSWFPGQPVRVVVHYDAIKFREVSVTYTAQQIDDWHSWAVAVATAILLDDTAAPRLNPGCPNCPVRYTCPAFEKMPEIGEVIAGTGKGLEDVAALAEWREQANTVRLMLQKSVKAADARIEEAVLATGEVVAGGMRWAREESWVTRVDAQAVHRLLGDRFYDAVSVTKAGVERVIDGWAPDEQAQVLACFIREPGPLTMTKKKASA